MEKKVLFDIDDKKRAHITLNRPEIGNAFDDETVSLLSDVFLECAENDSVHVILLRGAGKHFCAGADLNWMKAQANYTREENLADARKLAQLFYLLKTLPKPTLALAHGAVYGGGVGLLACADLVVGSYNTKICLSEVRLGLVPSVISPYLVQALGDRQARRYMLTSEVISAEVAQDIGLVHQLVETENLDAYADSWASLIGQNGPRALAATKHLLERVQNCDDTTRAFTVDLIADVRVGEEAQEGMQAFFEEREPSWRS